MKVNDAVKAKINKILFERNMTVNKLAVSSGLMQSTVDSILNGRSKNPTLGTICKICHGINMPLSEFFQDEVFEDIDVE